MSSLLEKYKVEVLPKLKEEFLLKNPFSVPRLERIVVNIGLGEALTNKKAMPAAGDWLAIITGQKPVATRAKRAISGFKIQGGDEIGLKVTLRGARMYNFLEKLIAIVLPRVRDFRGVSEKSFDGRGNFTLGVKEAMVFPEIEYSQIDKARGLEVTIVTTAKNDKEGKRLLELLGMPFKNEKRI